MKGNEMTDVALIVEGSYPYVTGGVSAWTQQLIEGLPDVSFSVAHLGGSGTARYRRPQNLVEVVRNFDAQIADRSRHERWRAAHNDFGAELLLTLKFDDAGKWKIVKTHRMSEKEVEKIEKGE
jgi:hypothetical protein